MRKMIFLVLLIGLSCAGWRPQTAHAQDPTETPTPAAPTIAGCQIFPNDNPWNTDISQAPLHPNSDNYVANINSNGSGTKVHPDFGSDPTYGIPWITVTASQPKVPVTFTWDDQSDPGPYPIPPNAPIEAGSDQHVLVLESTNCLLYEMYNSTFVGGPQNAWEADAGALFDLKSNKLRPDTWTSADAAGLPILPGLARCDEVNAGVITHALRFTVHRTQRAYVYPARHYASSLTDPNYPPMGLRMRLKANYNLAGFTGQALVIATALKKYGIILADNGSNWYISGETNPTCWDDDSLNQLKNIPGTAFEAVLATPDDTAGVYRPSGSTFYLRNQNSTGPTDFTLALGGSGDMPAAGDWNGDGVDTIGIYRSSSGRFFLKDSNLPSAPIAYSFLLGTTGDRPMVGDWNGDGKDGIGVLRPSNGLLYATNTLATGFAAYTMVLGVPGDLPVAGDWDQDGLDSPGVFRPSNGIFYLTNKVQNGVVYADYTAAFGANGDLPMAGDWDGDGRTGIGVYRGNIGRVYLKNNPATTGYPDISLSLGAAGDLPTAGNWTLYPGMSASAPIFAPGR